MFDRRQRFRGRVYYGGVVAVDARNSTINCVVRNFSPFGAKVEFGTTTLLPDEVDFTIPRRAFSCVARIVWRSANEAGFQFRNPKRTDPPIPLDWALRLRASERDRKSLQARIDQILSRR
jgi:hypothetical protein